MRPLTCGLTLALFLAMPAIAQTNAPLRLNEINVEARKIDEALRDVPIGVSVIRSDILSDAAAAGQDITYLSARTPSLIAESSFGRTFPRFYIRGLGNPDFDLNSTQPISVVYDGVPYENPILKGFPIFDVASVEVLRGPQGTLFGRNTTGGTIRIDSARPEARFFTSARASYGSYDTANLTGVLNFEMGARAQVRLSGLSQSRGDFIDNGATGDDDAFGGYEERALRLQVAVQPRDTIDLNLALTGRRLEADQTLFRANIFDPGANDLNANYDRDNIFNDAVSRQKLDHFGATLNAVWRLGEGDRLEYVGGFQTAQIGTRGDGDGGAGASFLGTAEPAPIPFPSESGGVIDDLEQVTHELRLVRERSDLTWQVGVFAFDERVDILSLAYDTLAGGVQTGRADRQQKTEAWAVFAAADYALTDRLSVSGGLRYTDDSRNFTVERLQSPFGAGPLGPVGISVGDEQVSWDLGATYDFTDRLSGYARIARGFRAPTVQGRFVFGSRTSVADSETVLSGETGLRFGSERLQGSAAVFYYLLEDQQLSAIGGQDNTVRLINADEGVGYGLEAEASWQVSDGFTLSGALTWTETEIRDADLAVPGCGAPCTITDTRDANGNVLIDGNPFPYAPDWIANLAAEYVLPVRGGEWFARTDWAYTGGRNFLLYESAEFFGDGFWEGGARLGYRSETGWDVSLFARNLTDEDAVLGAIDFNNLAGYVNEPRVVGLEVGWALD